MSSALTLLPLLLAVAVYSALVKVASRVYGKSHLAWKHAVSFSALGVVMGAVGALMNQATGKALPVVLAIVLGIGIQVALGGWFLGPRAVAPSGAPVSFKGGALIAAIAVVLGLVLGVLAANLLPALLPHGQA